MQFVLSNSAFCGKLSRTEFSTFSAFSAAVLRELRDKALKLSNCRSLSPPLIDHLPPDQSNPFIHEGFRPLPMRPPACAKLLFIPRSGGRIFMSGNFLSEDAQRTTSMKV